MKVELSISDVEEICEFFWWKYQDEQEKYLASHNEIATHCDEYNPEKANQLLDEAGWKDTYLGTSGLYAHEVGRICEL